MPIRARLTFLSNILEPAKTILVVLLCLCGYLILTPPSHFVCVEPSAASVVQLREDSTGGVVGLWDVTTRLPISTGSRIVLETTDPVRLPLPDADLLELHWVLQRVAAMAGNAEPRDDKYDTDDEDDEMFGVWADDGSDLTFPCHKNRPLR